MTESEIQKFYKNTNIFITGGTGFMGKILIEKLLRSTEVAIIYILIRNKKNKNPSERLDEIFDDKLFDKLKSQNPKYFQRVVGLSGDVAKPGLDLNISDRKLLISNVNIVFHVAATVRFDEHIHLAYAINVDGTKAVLELCKEMKALTSFIYVSTAYSNCYRKEIDEIFYDCPTDIDEVKSNLDQLSYEEAELATPEIIGKWPNTYTFTKALAEMCLKKSASGVPTGIFRPSIIVSAYNEPIRGWIDNLYGPTAVTVSVASGLVRVFPGNESIVADLIPIDTCVSALIAAAWDATTKNPEKNSEKIPIYNYVSSVENPITWGDYNSRVRSGYDYPQNQAFLGRKFFTVKRYQMYIFLRFFLHIIPASFLDFGDFLLGNEPKLLSLYKKVDKLSKSLLFFCLREWEFKNNNITRLWMKLNDKDKELFPFSMKNVNWVTYFYYYYHGVSIYLNKNPNGTFKNATKRLNRSNTILNILFILLFVFLIYPVSFLFNKILFHFFPACFLK